MVLAIVFYRSLKLRSLQLLLPLMILVCVVETAAHHKEYFGMATNYEIYKCYIVGAAIFYYIMFAKLLRMNKRIRILYWCIAVATMVFVFIDFLWISRGNSSTYTTTLTFLQQFILSCLLIAQLTMDDTQPVKLSADPQFWFAAGLMIFAACTTVLFGLHSYIRDNHLTLFGRPLYRALGPVINVVLYLFYSISILLCSRYKQMQPSS